MIFDIKEYIKDLREVYLHKQYEKEYKFQKNIYYAWRIENEPKQYKKKVKLHPEYVFLKGEGIQLADWANEWVNRKIAEGGNPDIIYGDEDYMDESGERSMPFFKPCWSPDTFRSFNYLGSCVCVKKSFYDKTKKNSKGSFAAEIYDCLLQMVDMGAKVEHISGILFHKRYKEKFVETREIGVMKEQFFSRQRERACVEYDDRSGCYRVRYRVKENPKVSVIIPSKDHPEVLKKCIESFVVLTAYKNYELIVVDNGSNEENRKKIEELLKKYGVSYYYSPMIFNYSRMCNLGASHAMGEYLLFLNDDIEILNNNWLERMLGHAQLEYIGAVGAKLLYPDKCKLQHIGATILGVGPAHKMISWPDDEDYYYHRNTLEYNYTIVTAACLLINKDKFYQVGCFDERMPINYNDVDLCIRLYKAGYYNVVRNDAILCHHESLSRGDDRMKKETRIRLKRELEYLYKKHPEFCKYDPFYNINLTDKKPVYEPKVNYAFEDMDLLNSCKTYEGGHIKNISAVLRLKVDKILYTDEIVHLEGWSYVMNADNAVYKRELVLRDVEGNASELHLSVFSKYRKDVEEQFPDEQNLGLAGFVCHIPIKKLQENTKYKVGIVASARFSRQRLYNEAEQMLDTTDEL